MSMVDQYPMENRKSYRNNGSIVIAKAFMQVVVYVYIQCPEQLLDKLAERNFP